MNHMKTERIGLFGGTFAPPHMGHVKAVKSLLRHVRLDKVLIMPTAIPPHKVKVKGDTPETRLEMCRAAFGGIEKAEISTYEIDKGGLSYSVDTLEHLTKEGRRIFMLCGGDMFKTALDSTAKGENVDFAKVVESGGMAALNTAVDVGLDVVGDVTKGVADLGDNTVATVFNTAVSSGSAADAAKAGISDLAKDGVEKVFKTGEDGD